MSYSQIRSWLRLPYAQDRIFGVIFFIVAFVPLVFTNYLNDNLEAPKLALWVMGVGLVLVLWARHQGSLNLKYNRWLLGLGAGFIIWSVVSTIFSLDVITSIVGLYGRLTSSLIFYTLWVVTLWLLVATLDRGKFIFLAKTLVFTSALIALLGIIQNYGVAYYGGIEDPVRPLVPSFLGNPNFSSMFIASLLPFGVWFLAEAKNFSSRLYYLTAILLIIIGLAIFASRGSIFAALASLIIVTIIALALKLGRRLVWGAVLALIVTAGVVWLFLSATRPQIVGQTFVLSENTVDTRFNAWNESFNIIQRYPLVGSGPGNFFIAFNQTAGSEFSNTDRFDDAHNLLLHLAANGGIPLVIIFMAMVGLALLLGWRSLLRQRDPLKLIIVAAIISWLISTSFNPVVVGCWLLLAVLLSALFLDEVKPKTVNFSRANKILLISGGIVLIVAAISFVASDALAVQATAAYNKRNYARSLQFAKWARYTNPTNPTVAAYQAASSIKLNLAPASSEKLVQYLVKIHPRSPRVQYMAGVLYYLLWQQSNDPTYKDKVQQSLAEALTLEPNQNYLKSHAAYLYYKIGDKDKAFYYERQTLIENPRQFYSWILLAQLYKEQGDKEKMLSALQRAQELEPSLVLLKHTVEQAQNQPDITKIMLPVNFPEPDI